MSEVKPEEFWRSLKGAAPAPVYLFYGKDSRAVDRAVAAMVEKVLGGAGDEFNADFYYGREADAAVVVAAAQTLPMMADKRLVVVRRIEEWKGPARERLLDYLGAPNPSTVLVLAATDLAGRKGRGGEKNGDSRESAKGPGGKGGRKEVSDAALVKAAGKAGLSVLFARPTADRLPGLIQEMAKARGKKIEGPAVELLVELAGDEMLGLEQELEKLILFLGDQNPITREDVLEAAADIKEANIFEFTDAIGARDVESALRAWRRMREQELEPLMVLGMLLRHFRLIWKIQEYHDRGESPGRIAVLAKVNEWILKKNYLPQLRKFPAADTAGIMRLLADLDLKMKSSRADKDILFERTLMKLCRGRRL